MSESELRWRITCSCGWHTEVSGEWAAKSAATLHPKVGASGVDHVVAIEAPDQPSAQPELPLG